MTSKQDLDNKLDNTTSRGAAPAHDVAQPHPKQAEAMKVFESFQRNRRMGMSIDIANIASQLRGAPTRATFPESLFVQHFLPLFADEVQPTEFVSIGTWISKVAGSENVPVDILDDNGEVVFTIPPMFDHSVLEQVKPGDLTMTRVERHYSRLKEYDASASQTFLSKTLSSMHIKEKPTEEVYANIATWNAIFERYGKKDKIINLLDPNDDPNKDRHVGGGGVKPSANDVHDFELDTD